MHTNGVSHVTVPDDFEGVCTILEWLSYIPKVPYSLGAHAVRLGWRREGGSTMDETRLLPLPLLLLVIPSPAFCLWGGSEVRIQGHKDGRTMSADPSEKGYVDNHEPRTSQPAWIHSWLPP